MSSTRHNASTTSSERKRLRDRRAQQNLRDKRESRMRALEERVAYCENNHSHELIQNWTLAVNSMRRENELLLARQEQLRRLFLGRDAPGNGTMGTHPAPLSSTYMAPDPRPTPITPICRPGSEISLINREIQTIPDWSVNRVESAHLGSTADSLTSPPMTSTWPVEIDSRDPCSPIIDLPPIPSMRVTQGFFRCPLLAHKQSPPVTDTTQTLSLWLALSDSIAKLPLLPSPFDLLHGSRRNWLADQINRVLRRLSLREPDRLAISWLVYVFIRWRADPTPLTFANMPHFLQPTSGQAQQGQQLEILFFLWPQLRVNLAEHGAPISILELYRYAVCSCRVRWSSTESIWEWDDDENMFMKPAFFQTFMNRSGWGLSSVFINEFPQLFRGMDVENIRYDLS
ncbi:hypothetical protein BDV26DRAFT_301868 [Aspergillus bertholletiae]|uniref:BZIP domain-containing protein n=1 Tax=Aspergillus bertholletiae TaxID=1226010 RepID=A0A5N7ARX9_9EURO|nr:hypothetical protein BDV26DRAFT_301868 [Aspergillus bertholletiae]